MKRVALLLVLLVPSLSPADEPGTEADPVHVELVVDLPVIAGSAAAALVPEIFKGEMPGPPCAVACDPGHLNALDRTVVGNHSAAADTASYALVGAAAGLPVVLDLVDTLVHRGPARWRGFGEDVLVLAEVASANFLVNNPIKYAVRRQRPLTYDPAFDAATRTAPDAALSFYSEHTSTAFAMATAYSYLFTLRHPRSRLVAPVWLGTHLLAATTAVLRVEAGRHFWTDVITGAVAGSSVGLVVSSLHHVLGRGPAGHYTARLLPVAFPGGGGLALAVLER